MIIFLILLQYLYKYKGQKHKNFLHIPINRKHPPWANPWGMFLTERSNYEKFLERFGKDGQELGHLGPGDRILGAHGAVAVAFTTYRYRKVIPCSRVTAPLGANLPSPMP